MLGNLFNQITNDITNEVMEEEQMEEKEILEEGNVIDVEEKDLIPVETADENNEEERSSLYKLMYLEIEHMDIPDKEKAKKYKKLSKFKDQKVNIMLVGSTGSGKSSTINALFDMNVAKVGEGVDPETQSIAKFELDNLTVWDTPGLGDGIERDEEIIDEILLKLQEKDENDKQLIDMVVMILDASTKDLGTYYKLINDVLIPEFGSSAKKRILIALNQSDIAMKGTHWNEEANEPDTVLEAFLAKKAESVRNRIKENTGLDIKPVCYCAGYSENGVQRKPYNLTKLLYYIVKAAPKAKRLNIAENTNRDDDNWLHNDADYGSTLGNEFGEILWSCISDGAESGAEIGGDIFGIPGRIIGGALGGLIGGVTGFFEALAI